MVNIEKHVYDFLELIGQQQVDWKLVVFFFCYAWLKRSTTWSVV